MPTIIHGSGSIVWGVPPNPKPINTHGIEGRCRVRFREGAFATLYILTPQGVRLFYLADEGDCYYPTAEIGRNLTITPAISNP